MPYCSRLEALGSESSSNGQWCFGVSKATDVPKTGIPNFSTVDSQFASVINLTVGFTHTLPGNFGMASVDVDRRQLIVGYTVLAAQLKDESDLAYGLDLFDAIDRCRRQRDYYYQLNNVLAFRLCEQRRNEHITALAKLLEKDGLSIAH